MLQVADARGKIQQIFSQWRSQSSTQLISCAARRPPLSCSLWPPAADRLCCLARRLWTTDGFRLYDPHDIWPLVDQDTCIVASDKRRFPGDIALLKRAMDGGRGDSSDSEHDEHVDAEESEAGGEQGEGGETESDHSAQPSRKRRRHSVLVVELDRADTQQPSPLGRRQSVVVVEADETLDERIARVRRQLVETLGRRERLEAQRHEQSEAQRRHQLSLSVRHQRELDAFVRGYHGLTSRLDLTARRISRLPLADEMWRELETQFERGASMRSEEDRLESTRQQLIAEQESAERQLAVLRFQRVIIGSYLQLVGGDVEWPARRSWVPAGEPLSLLEAAQQRLAFAGLCSARLGSEALLHVSDVAEMVAFHIRGFDHAAELAKVQRFGEQAARARAQFRPPPPAAGQPPQPTGFTLETGSCWSPPPPPAAPLNGIRYSPSIPIDGTYLLLAEHQGFPVFLSEHGIYMYRCRDAWFLRSEFRPDELDCQAYIRCTDGLPLGARSWRCAVQTEARFPHPARLQWSRFTLNLVRLWSVAEEEQMGKLFEQPSRAHGGPLDLLSLAGNAGSDN